MKGRRWKHSEDALLKKTVLEFIRSGRTQLAAFAHVGRQINRTPGACGFRWNAVLRQQDPASYQEAKKSRVYKKLQEKRSVPVTSLQQAIRGLQQMEMEEQRMQEEIAMLQKKLEQCRERQRELENERQTMNERQQALSVYQQQVRDKYQDLLYLLEQQTGSPSSSSST